MSTITIETVDPAIWDTLVRELPDRTVFHLRPWLESLAAVNGARLLLAQAMRDGRCVAVWPTFELRKGPLRILGSPVPGWSTTYLGPLFDSTVDPEGPIRAFLGHDSFRRYAYFACRVIDRQRPIDLGRFGFSRVKRFPTYWIDLTQSEGTLWGHLKSECRTRIRRAEKLGVEVRPETTPDFIEDFWTMSLETFARSGTRPTYTKELLHEIWNRLRPAGQLEVISAFAEGRRIATLVLPHDDRTTYYWGGASFQELRHLPSGNLLHWRAMLAARERNLSGYDLISINGGPGRFKKTFGPSVVEMATHWERSPSRWLVVLKACYERYLRLRLGIRSDAPPVPGTEAA